MKVEEIVFYIVGIMMVFCALRVVTGRFIFRSALYLAATLALSAVLYLLLDAEFLAAVQILVYVGAVVILIIFAVMLTAQLGDAAVFQTNALAIPAAGFSMLLWGVMVWVLARHPWHLITSAPADPAVSSQAAQQAGNVGRIGYSLLTSWLLPFELIALVLFAALVGAVLIARKED
jgi:NADH-quinone oxidoreductase subunit J